MALILTLLYYSNTQLKNVQLLIQKAENCWIPLHEVAAKLGTDSCKLQPFLYAFSGKDDSCSLFNIGKSEIPNVRHRLYTKVLAEYGKYGSTEITNDVQNAAQKLLVTCYSQDVQFESLAAQQAHLFLSGGRNQDNYEVLATNRGCIPTSPEVQPACNISAEKKSCTSSQSA